MKSRMRCKSIDKMVQVQTHDTGLLVITRVALSFWPSALNIIYCIGPVPSRIHALIVSAQETPQQCMDLITTRPLTLLGLRTMDVQQILDIYGGLPPSAFTVHDEASAALIEQLAIHGLYWQEQSNVHENTETFRSCKIS